MDDLVVVQIGDARKHLPGIASQAVVPQSMRSSCCCLSERCWVDVFNDYNVVVLFVVSFSMGSEREMRKHSKQMVFLWCFYGRSPSKWVLHDLPRTHCDVFVGAASQKGPVQRETPFIEREHRA